MFCRDVYHCNPVEFYKIPAKYLLQDMTILNMEAQVRNKKR